MSAWPVVISICIHKSQSRKGHFDNQQKQCRPLNPQKAKNLHIKVKKPGDFGKNLEIYRRRLKE